MTPQVNLPQHQRAAIEELASLTDEGYQAIRESLNSTGPLAEPTALIEQVSKAVASQTRLGGQVTGMVIGLRSLVDRSALTVSWVAEAVTEDAVSKKWISQETGEVFKQRLSELLQMRALAISAKAFTLAVGDESPFADARIISDVRPIFSGPDTALEFAGSVIVHHLAIEVSSSADDLYCALSTADLLKLRRTVERAIEKDKTLRSMLRNGPMAPLESDGLSGEKSS